MGLGSDAWEYESGGGATVAAAPDCHEDARKLLAKRGIYVKRIVRVDSDAILFLNPAGRAETAWLSAVSGDQKILREQGFPAWPEE